MEAKDKQYLYDMYNATSTDDGTGNDELETYEKWLERQLLSRLKSIVQLQSQLNEANEKLKVINSILEDINVIMYESYMVKSKSFDRTDGLKIMIKLEEWATKP